MAPSYRSSAAPFIDHVAELQRLTHQRRGRKRRRGSGGRWSSEAPQGGGKKKKKVKRKGATGGRVMPEALSRVYGEAQRFYMRAEYRDSLRLLNEITRQAPTVPEPYQLMGQIYEDQGDFKKVGGRVGGWVGGWGGLGGLGLGCTV